jgi:hypothetical protein
VDKSATLDASIGASGPHVFAVRISRARQSQPSRPPHPTARFVTIASRPSVGETRGETPLICPTRQAEYFLRQVWTGQITLKWFNKLGCARRGHRADVRRIGPRDASRGCRRGYLRCPLGPSEQILPDKRAAKGGCSLVCCRKTESVPFQPHLRCFASGQPQARQVELSMLRNAPMRGARHDYVRERP